MAFQLNLQIETVEHASARKPFCVEPDVTVRDVLHQLRQERRGSAAVCRDGVLVGIFTERDALSMLASKKDLDVKIETVMTPNPTTVLITETMGNAIQKMSRGGYRRLPIVDEQGRPVGILKVAEVLHYLVQHFPEFVYNLPPTPDQTSTQREGA